MAIKIKKKQQVISIARSASILNLFYRAFFHKLQQAPSRQVQGI